MLRFLTEKMRVGAREDKNTAVAVDRAQLASCVARQPGMTGRMYVARAHALAHLEAWEHRNIPACGPAMRKNRKHLIGSKRRSRFRRIQNSLPSLKLSACHQAALDQEFNQPRNPFLVIAHPQIFSGGDQLPLVTRAVEGPFSPGSHCQRQRECASLPALVEHRLLVLGLDRAQAMHATHVMDAVHE